MTLSAVEFLRRFFQHLLPPGFVRIRYYAQVLTIAESPMATLPLVLPIHDPD